MMQVLKKTAASAVLSVLAVSAWAQSQVKISTNLGDIVVELDAEKAPKSVANFEQYVRDKHYDGTVFHRVIKDFMIQGGGFDLKMRQKETRGPIELEANNGLRNQRGTIAMARTNDPNSATAQFFINVVDNDFLNAAPGNPGYAVFGRVIEGMDVADKIRAVATTRTPYMQDVPSKPVIILKAEMLAAKPKAAVRPAAKK